MSGTTVISLAKINTSNSIFHITGHGQSLKLKPRWNPVASWTTLTQPGKAAGKTYWPLKPGEFLGVDGTLQYVPSLIPLCFLSVFSTFMYCGRSVDDICCYFLVISMFNKLNITCHLLSVSAIPINVSVKLTHLLCFAASHLMPVSRWTTTQAPRPA